MKPERKGVLVSLKEAIFGAPKEETPIKKSTTIVVNTIEKDYGTRLSTSLKDQVKAFNDDGLIRQKVQEFGQEVISTGYFTTQNEEYKIILNGKSAKPLIDDWNRANDIDRKLMQMAVEITAFGNSFWIITDNGFVNLPVEAVQKAIPVNKSTPLREEYHLLLSGYYKSKTINYGEFMHPRINVTGNAPFGTGVIFGLVSHPDEDTPSLYEVHTTVRKAINDAFLRFSNTNSLWTFENASDEAIKELEKKLNSMEIGGKSQRIASNVKGDIKLEIPERTSSFDKWIESIEKEFNSALGTGITPDTEYTTKATAEAIREYYEMRITNLRRVIKRVMESIWTKILDELGYDGKLANIKLHFGSQEIDYVVEDVFKAQEQKIINTKEARNILRKYSKWEIPNEYEPDQESKVEEVENDEG